MICADKADVGGGWIETFRSMIRGVVHTVKEEVMAELSSSVNDMNSVLCQLPIHFRDDPADRTQMKE